VAWGFSVRHDAPLSSWELPLRAGVEPGAARILRAGGQRLVLANDMEEEVVARVERGSGREDAVTAAEAASTALFRQLFPTEVLARGVSSRSTTSRSSAPGWSIPGRAATKGAAFARLTSLHAELETVTAAGGGAVVKIHRDGVLATFHDPIAALCAARTLVRGDIALALHAGSAMATSINDRLDYFGASCTRSIGCWSPPREATSW
jgi:hypothetical protein